MGETELQHPWEQSGLGEKAHVGSERQSPLQEPADGVKCEAGERTCTMNVHQDDSFGFTDYQLSHTF